MEVILALAVLLAIWVLVIWGSSLFQQERRLKSHHAINEKTGRFVIARSQRVRPGRPDVRLRDGAIQFACKNLDCFAPAITLLYR